MPDEGYQTPNVEFGWQHCLSVPRELYWANGRLTAQPVKELEQLRENAQEFSFAGDAEKGIALAAELELENHGDRLTLALEDAAYVCWKDGLLTFSLDPSCGYGRTTRTAVVPTLHNLRLLVDHSSLELFLNGGERVLSARFYPKGACTLELNGTGRAKLYDLHKNGDEDHSRSRSPRNGYLKSNHVERAATKRG